LYTYASGEKFPTVEFMGSFLILVSSFNTCASSSYCISAHPLLSHLMRIHIVTVKLVQILSYIRLTVVIILSKISRQHYEQDGRHEHNTHSKDSNEANKHDIKQFILCFLIHPSQSSRFILKKRSKAEMLPYPEKG
jgi:hypothetical protein